MNPELVLCAGTLRAASLAEKCEAAVAGGFRAITIWPSDLDRARREGIELADAKRMIADHGLSVLDLDALIGWLPDESAPPGFASEPEFYAIADALGARSLNVVQGFGTSIDVDRAAEALAGVCDRAQEHGLLVTLEYLPWTGIPDAATALAIVERSGRANAALMFDTWHTFRGPTDEAQLEKIPAARIGSVQINDAPAEPAADLVAETLSGRLLPGDGAAPLVRWLRWLDAIGSTAPIGVEVFSSALDALPPVEAGRRCGEAARAVIAAARAALPVLLLLVATASGAVEVEGLAGHDDLFGRYAPGGDCKRGPDYQGIEKIVLPFKRPDGEYAIMMQFNYAEKPGALAISGHGEGYPGGAPFGPRNEALVKASPYARCAQPK